MKHIINKVLYLINLIKKGEFKFLWSGISKRIYSENLSYGLKRDLNVEIPTPPSLLKLSIRQYLEKDEPYFESDYSNLGIIAQKHDYCYVATKDDIPVYRVWLIPAYENDKIRDFWGDSYPPLKKNEALCENSFTVPKFRGFGIMPYAMKVIAEKSAEFGADTVIIYTAIDHIVSLRAGDYAGYIPFNLRKEKWLLFKRTTTFEDDIPEELMEHYKKVTQRKRRVKKSTK